MISVCMGGVFYGVLVKVVCVGICLIWYVL